MRTLLNQPGQWIVWGLFFVTTLYGHIALKVAAGDGAAFNWRRALQACSSAWGWTALLAWAISGFLWAVVLTGSGVLAANSISALRYILICGAAWLFLNESIRWRDAVGILLVTAGLWMLCR